MSAITRPLLSLRPRFLSAFAFAPAAAAAGGLPALGQLAAGVMGGLSSLLELLPPIVLAVPKHKVTHSRKSMRSANKGLKNKTNLSHCEACGTLKLSHNICPNCYSQITRRWKKEAREPVTKSD